MPDNPQNNPDPELQKILEELRDEMGGVDMQEVVRVITNAVVQRTNIVCPSCGHKANCTNCMSPEKIADEIMSSIENP